MRSHNKIRSAQSFFFFHVMIIWINYCIELFLLLAVFFLKLFFLCHVDWTRHAIRLDLESLWVRMGVNFYVQRRHHETLVAKTDFNLANNNESIVVLLPFSFFTIRILALA